MSRAGGIMRIPWVWAMREGERRTAVSDDDALGGAGAARGVHDHGGVLGLGGRWRGGVRLALSLELGERDGSERRHNLGGVGLAVDENNGPGEK